MNKHTPGPWQILITLEICADNKHICEMKSWMDEDQANAQLISAAPDLLKVLEELRECSDYWSEYDVPLGIVDRINAAIAKAKGEV